MSGRTTWLDSPWSPPHQGSLPWSTNESGQYETRRRREQRAAADARTHSYPFRGLQLSLGDSGASKSHERPLPRWLARLVKRNTFWCHFYFQFGLSIGAVMRWKVVYAPSWIRSIARLSGSHPIAVAEHYIRTGREIVSAVPDDAQKDDA